MDKNVVDTRQNALRPDHVKIDYQCDYMPPKLVNSMDYLESEYAATRGRQPYDDARRALLACSSTVLQLAEKITRKFKDKESIDATLNKCIAGDKPQPWKELCDLAEAIGNIKGIFNDAKRAEEKRKEREEKKRLRADAIATATAIATAAADAIAAVAAAKAAKVPPVTKPRKEKQKIPKVIKDEIWDYYIGNDVAQAKCPCCQKTPITMREFVAGHVLSEKNGGAVTCENLVPICNKCNSSMGARHIIEFTLAHYGRQPICPRNPVVCKEFAPESNYVRYDHCRASAGGHTDASKFPSDEEAIAHANAKGYATIVHKANSSAMYYFMDKPCRKYKIATSEKEGGWEYVSWLILSV